MPSTPRFAPRSGLAGLGLVLLAAALVGGLLCFLVFGGKPQSRGTHAAERGTPRSSVELEATTTDDLRGAPLVELVPAGSQGALAAPAAPAESSAQVVASENTLALDQPADTQPEALTAAADDKVEGPALKYVREGKTEIVNGREERRGRRNDRKERAEEAAALGVQNEKRAVAPPKKNATRTLPKKAEPREQPPAKRSKPTPPADGASGG